MNVCKVASRIRLREIKLCLRFSFIVFYFFQYAIVLKDTNKSRRGAFFTNKRNNIVNILKTFFNLLVLII